MRPPIRRWLTGLVTGIVAGVGTLVAGPIAGVLGVAAILLAVAETPRPAAIGGALVGLGGTWVALFGRVMLTCRRDCVAPDLTAWVVAAGILAGFGLVVSVRAVRSPDAGR